MDVGVTATRKGITEPQSASLTRVLRVLQERDGAESLHHGDCIGGDVQATTIARRLGYRVVSHPPTVPRLRAYCPADEVLPPLPYLERDRRIVDTVAVLVACPDGSERKRSGTWYTVRYARRRGVRTVIVWPDGTISLDAQAA